MAAETLSAEKVNLDAMYLAGYAIECSLKALILECSPSEEKTQTLKNITRGAKMHNIEILIGILKDHRRPIPLVIVKRLRKSSWSTELRYKTGRSPTGHTRAFLKTAKAVYDWVGSQLP
jgi:HEPN domain-containing protein